MAWAIGLGLLVVSAVCEYYDVRLTQMGQARCAPMLIFVLRIVGFPALIIEDVVTFCVLSACIASEE